MAFVFICLTESRPVEKAVGQGLGLGQGVPAASVTLQVESQGDECPAPHLLFPPNLLVTPTVAGTVEARQQEALWCHLPKASSCTGQVGKGQVTVQSPTNGIQHSTYVS